MRRKYTLSISASLITLLLLVTTTLTLKNPLITGLMILTSFLLFRTAEKTSKVYGRTDKIKMINTFTKNLIEFTALTASVLFNPEPLLSAYTIAIIGFWISFKTEYQDETNQKIPSAINRTERILILTTIFLATSFNQYSMVYGLAGLSIIVITNLLRSVYTTTR